MPKRNLKAKPKSKTQNFKKVILVGKAIVLSLKAIKTIEGPDIGQLCAGVCESMWFHSSNVHKGKYNDPLGEITWPFHKQLFYGKIDTAE